MDHPTDRVEAYLAHKIDQYLDQMYLEHVVAKVDLYLQSHDTSDEAFRELFRLGGYGILREATKVKNARVKA